jgi:hypothetical protein
VAKRTILLASPVPPPTHPLGARSRDHLAFMHVACAIVCWRRLGSERDYMKSLSGSRTEALRSARTRGRKAPFWRHGQQNGTGEKLLQPLFIWSLWAVG